jgi:hypothetical protein
MGSLGSTEWIILIATIGVITIVAFIVIALFKKIAKPKN